MYSVYLKRLSDVWGRSSKSEAPSDSTIRQSTFVIRHSSFQSSFIRALPLAKKTASLIKEKKLNPQIVGS